MYIASLHSFCQRLLFHISLYSTLSIAWLYSLQSIVVILFWFIYHHVYRDSALHPTQSNHTMHEYSISASGTACWESPYSGNCNFQFSEKSDLAPWRYAISCVLTLTLGIQVARHRWRSQPDSVWRQSASCSSNSMWMIRNHDYSQHQESFLGAEVMNLGLTSREVILCLTCSSKCFQLEENLNTRHQSIKIQVLPWVPSSLLDTCMCVWGMGTRSVRCTT